MKMIIMVLIIAVIIFLINIKRVKNNKKSNEISTIDKRRDYMENRRITTKKTSGANDYVTKYNSKTDYREK